MSDAITSDQRKFCIPPVSGHDTQPELALRKGLWVVGYRYRVRNKLPVKPDKVFSRRKLAVFIDGCFWDKFPRHFVIPKTRTKFWMDKINKNYERDTSLTKELKQSG